MHRSTLVYILKGLTPMPPPPGLALVLWVWVSEVWVLRSGV